ncbi:hypothetical protein SCUP234_10608 [Seiridium cupressi]
MTSDQTSPKATCWAATKGGQCDSRSYGVFLQGGAQESTATLGSDSFSTNPSSSRDTGLGSNDGEMSTGAKAGISAGAGAGGLALMGAAVFFLIGRRRRRDPVDPTDQPEMTSGSIPGWKPLAMPNHHSHIDGREVLYSDRAATLAAAMEGGGAQSESHKSYEDARSSVISPFSRGAHEMGRTTESIDCEAGLIHEHHEMPGPVYYEMPSPPDASYSLTPGCPLWN